VTVSWHRAPAHGAEVTLRVEVPDNVQATVALPAGTGPYAAAGAGAPRYEGAHGGQVIYSVGSGVTTFRPAGR
jgi:hypothetical protein